MKVQYCDDTRQGPGFGTLVCSEGDFRATTYDVSLQRASDRTFVSNDGDWQEPKATIALMGAVLADGSLALPLSPAIVNTLATTDTYQLTIVPRSEDGTAKPASARLHIETISYSKEDPLAHTLVVEETPIAPDTISLADVVPEPVATSDAAPLPPPPPPQTPKPKSPARPLLLLCLLLAALVLAYLAYHVATQKASAADETLSPEKAAAEKAPEKQVPEQVAPKTAPPSEAPKTNALPPKASAPEPLRTEQAVSRFFQSSNRGSAEAADLSKRLAHTTASEQDAIFRLYYFAAERGEVSVLLDYAACFDPVKPAWGTIAKNAPEAWAIYEKAKAHPELADTAKAAQDALRAWLTEQEAKGSSTARAWRLQLPN